MQSSTCIELSNWGLKALLKDPTEVRLQDGDLYSLGQKKRTLTTDLPLFVLLSSNITHKDLIMPP